MNAITNGAIMESSIPQIYNGSHHGFKDVLEVVEETESFALLDKFMAFIGYLSVEFLFEAAYNNDNGKTICVCVSKFIGIRREIISRIARL